MTDAHEQVGYVCPLRPREIEAVKLFADGYSAKQAAHVMAISIGALGYLTTSACRAANAANKTQLVSIALRKGWIQ